MQMPSSATAILAARLGAGGQATSVASACASGAEAVFTGLDRIRRGLCDVVLVGSTEAEGPHIWGAFDSLRVLTRASNDNPEAASRPMSARASGFVPASGAGALLLESKEHAERRGAKIYCELLGGHVNCGARRNGGTMTAPNQLAMRLCVREALRHARITPAQVDLISGHLTATAGDPNEINAWSDALERKGRNFPLINAPKSLFGHALSGSGSIELVACALQLDDGFVHPSINCEDLHPQILETIAPECVVRELRSTRTTTIAKASFGFGDVNACVVLHKPN
jgi:3-oxoacyl-(acyl-carrier-protein) synthase